MEENKISCADAAALMEKYLDGELDAAGKTALLAHIETCEACSCEFEKLKKTTELLKEASLEPPAELYSSVMAKINTEKKKKKLFIRRFGTVCAAALVFVVASVYMMPKFMVGTGNTNDLYSPDGITFHNAKSSNGESSVYDAAEGERILLCSLLSDAEVKNGEYFKLREYENNKILKLANIQTGTLMVVCEGDGYGVYNLSTGERVYLCDLIGGESTDTNFSFLENGIKLNDCIVYTWDWVTDEAKEKYELTSSPLIMEFCEDAGYELLAVEETQ